MSFNILLAEDDEDIVKLLKLYLENEGFSTFWAKDGVEATEIFDKQKIDLALVDIMMPRMNGYELTKYIRQKSNVPIIILSAAQLDSDKILGLNLGADDYMVKPFNPLELIARINANLRRFYKLGNVQEEDDGKITIGELTLDTNTLTLEKKRRSRQSHGNRIQNSAYADEVARQSFHQDADIRRGQRRLLRKRRQHHDGAHIEPQR